MAGDCEGGEGGVVAPASAADPVADTSLDTPNCPACLHRMAPMDTATGAVYWGCPECGQTRVA